MRNKIWLRNTGKKKLVEVNGIKFVALIKVQLMELIKKHRSLFLAAKAMYICIK
jgi:hypothetical protein